MINLNCWRRDLHLEDWIKKTDFSKSEEWGKKRKPQKYMTEYGYAQGDKDERARRNSKPIIGDYRERVKKVNKRSQSTVYEYPIPPELSPQQLNNLMEKGK